MLRPLSNAARRHLARIVGPQNVLTNPGQLADYSHDAAPLLKGNPCAAAIVRSAAQVSAILRWANITGVPVVPRGAGTGLSGGAVPLEGWLVLDMTPMNRILEIDRKNLTAWVEPGVLTATLQREVEP